MQLVIGYYIGYIIGSLLISLATSALMRALSGDRNQAPPRPTIDDIAIPNSMEAQAVRYPFGSPSQRAPLVAWYDNLTLTPILSSGGKK